MDKVSHLTYNDIVQFYLMQMNRVEVLWFRIMYMHAALFAVLVFFYQAEGFLFEQRVLVLAIYTVNLLIFFVAMQDGYAAMISAVEDLKSFEKTDGQIDQRFREMNLKHKTMVRFAFLISAWVLIAYLLLGSVL